MERRERNRIHEASLRQDNGLRVLTIDLAQSLSTVGTTLPSDTTYEQLVDPDPSSEWGKVIKSLDPKVAKEVRRAFRGARRGIHYDTLGKLREDLENQFLITKVGPRGRSALEIIVGVGSLKEAETLELGLVD